MTTSDGKVRRWYCYGKDDFGHKYNALCDEESDGEYVLADDHIALLTERDATVARLNERLDDALGDYMPVVTERDSLRAKIELLERELEEVVSERDRALGR
jgi:hypothetical protein